ncbi:hypothetical protein M9H77_36343 [Catharanthus roseus]|uniref:Uncharacterized protein n=1 Tax=Catharanthus roseus TaxID=4058 RepID=A0ACB9ZSD0_CATRO|nr:hypothetical protein M9H77_36343 [Catharanthus roseus]
MKKKATHVHWEITRFTKEHTCLVHVSKQASKYIPLSNVIQEVQLLLQRVCTYKRTCCGKWREYTLPYFHALAECRENGTRPDAYVPDICW